MSSPPSSISWCNGRKWTPGLALYGISQAGYWVPRALAFEHRIAAAVADPG